MSASHLEVTSDPGAVWRVGFRPDPWVWSDWKYAQEDGRFGGRWDDEEARFRTIYTADSLYACLVELLAELRPHNGVDARPSRDRNAGVSSYLVRYVTSRQGEDSPHGPRY